MTIDHKLVRTRSELDELGIERGWSRFTFTRFLTVDVDLFTRDSEFVLLRWGTDPIEAPYHGWAISALVGRPVIYSDTRPEQAFETAAAYLGADERTPIMAVPPSDDRLARVGTLATFLNDGFDRDAQVYAHTVGQLLKSMLELSGGAR